MNLQFIFLVQSYLVVFTTGERCQTLDGLWSNEEGAQLTLNQDEDGILFGRYTSAEGELDIASKLGLQSPITGAAVYNQSGPVFSMSVMWLNGFSIKAWIGQCLMCGSDEVLHTSWLLRRRVDDCTDKWLPTAYGETRFKRQVDINEPTSQPYSTAETHTKALSHDTDATSTSPQRSVSSDATSRPTSPEHSADSDATTTIPPQQSCSLDGFWYNQLGSELLITSHQNMTIRGEYRTAVELSTGAAGTSYSAVYGMANNRDTSSAIALYVVWNDGTSVTGWVGQCHLCGANQTETLVTTWLLRTKVKSCDENWGATNIGEDFFTRDEQRSGPRKRLGTSTPTT